MKPKIYRLYLSPFDPTQERQALSHWTAFLKELKKNASLRPIKIHISINRDAGKKLDKLRQQTFETLNEIFPGQMPAFSIVSQPPANQSYLTAEIILSEKEDETELHFFLYRNRPHVLLSNGNFRELWSSGLTAVYDADSDSPVEQAARKCFSELSSLLAETGFDYDDILRQWNYIGHILQIQEKAGRKLQNYQVFNEIRAEYYQKRKSDPLYPAATGIGMEYPGICLDFVAVSGNLSQDKNNQEESAGSAIRKKKGPMQKTYETGALHSPIQKNAYDYAQECLIGDNLQNGNDSFPGPEAEKAERIPVNPDPGKKKTETRNKKPPLFERGRFYRVLEPEPSPVFAMISGTASIKGEQTIGKDDAQKQLENTITFIDQLVEGPSSGKACYDRARLYVKPGFFRPEMAECFLSRYQSEGICSIVEADICRNDLLVEIEADLHFPAGTE